MHAPPRRRLSFWARPLLALAILLVATAAQARRPPRVIPDHELATRVAPWLGLGPASRLPVPFGPHAPPLPGSGSRAPRAFDLLTEAGDVTIDPTTGLVDGTTTLTLHAESTATPDLALLVDQGLSFVTATAPGYTVAINASPYDVLTYAELTFSPKVPIGQDVTLTVTYSGTLLCQQSGARDSQYCGMGGALDYFMDGGPFPMVLDGGDPYRFDTYQRDMVLHVPSGGNVLASSDLQSTDDDGTTLTTTWHAAEFSTGMFFIMLAGDFGSAPVPGVTPPSNIGHVQASTSWVSEMAGWETHIIPFIDTQVGQSLPFAGLTVFKLPELAGFPGTATYSMVYLAEYYASGGAEYFEETLAHETVHLWWGILVAPTDISSWLVEGPAVFTQYDYTAATHHGSEDRTQYLGSRYHWNELLVRYLTNPATLPDLVLPNAIGYPNTLNEQVTWAYFKSSATLEHLEVIVGETAFAAGLKAYGAACEYAPCTTADFRTAMEQASGQDLGFFFNQWVYDTNYPKVLVAFTQQGDQPGGGSKVSVTLTQDLDLTVPLELLLTRRDGSIETHAVTLQGTSGSFDIDAAGPVRSVRPNPRQDAIVWSHSAELADPDFTGQVDGRDLIRCARLDGVKAISGDPAVDSIYAVDLDFEARCDLNDDTNIDQTDLDTIIERFGTGVQP